MDGYLSQLSVSARRAALSKDWATVDACAKEMLRQDAESAEAHFLTGLVGKAIGRGDDAIAAFSRAIDLDAERYDAGIELANQHCAARRNGEAAQLLARYVDALGNSPKYLNIAGSVYSGIGMPERAWRLYQQADELQPGVDLVQANLANCAVFLGRIDEAKAIYTRLLTRHPTHQRYHYQLSRLHTATDDTHVAQMQRVLEQTRLPPDRNIFMYYAIGKELEDLQRWDDAFEYYQRAGDAVTSVANYDIADDLRLIETFIDICDRRWLEQDPGAVDRNYTRDKTPIFVVGLPRTGTTLTERILASHSQVQSVGETQFMQMVLRRESGIESEQKMTPAMIAAAARLDIGVIGRGYMDMLDYKLDEHPFFVDKLPFNIFYLGFIAKAFPGAKIVYVKRNPMDSCFAMYKQVFTWAYKFSYTLEGLGRFYPAFLELVGHWQTVLGERIVEVEYEALVSNQEAQTRRLLTLLDLEFEAGCLHFEANAAATLTASAVQVREKIHARSVGRWRHFSRQLAPLKATLEKARIVID